MKLLILSDLHLDFSPFDAVPDGLRIDEEADAIVLAGDICEGSKGLHWARRTFGSKPIVYVAGNHEFYSHSYDELLQELRDVAAELDIHFLERNSVHIGDVLILGTTLWTDFQYFGPETQEAAMEAAKRGLNDFRLIRRTIWTDETGTFTARVSFKPEDALHLHLEARDWLEQELHKVAQSGNPSKTVVVTHHCPHHLSVEPKYESSPLTPCFTSRLAGLMGRSRYWIHGHTHSSHRYTVNAEESARPANSDQARIDTEVVCNPRGYAHRFQSGQENGLFEPGLLIEV